MKFISAVLIFFVFSAAAQNYQSALLQAKKYVTSQPQKAIALANGIYKKAIPAAQYTVAAQAAAVSAAALRNEGDFYTLLHYDSLYMISARLSIDSLLLADALTLYAQDLLSNNRIAIANKILAEAEKIIPANDGAKWYKWHLAKGSAGFKTMRHDDALSNYKKALIIAEASGADNDAMSCKLLIGQAVLFKGKPDSMHLVFKALDYFSKTKNYFQASTAASVIGFSFKVVANSAKAATFYSQALDYSMLSKNKKRVADARLELAEVYITQKKFAEAKTLITAAEKASAEMNRQTGVASAKVQMGRLYTGQSKFAQAALCFAEAEAINKDLQNNNLKFGITSYRMLLASKMNDKNAFDSLTGVALTTAANIQLDKDLKKMAITKMEENVPEATQKEREKLWTLFDPAATENIKNDPAFKIASRDFENIKTFNLYSGKDHNYDSSLTATTSLQLLDLETQYKTHVLSESLQLQQQENAIAKQKMKTRETIIISATALALLLAAGLALQYRNRKRAVRDKQKIELLQDEIHHRVENNLAVISRLVDVAGKTATDSRPLSALKTRIKSIELLHKHLYNEKAQTGNIALQSYFEELCREIAATFESINKITILVNAPTEVESHIAEKLGLILNELITNSFKYAFNENREGTIQINVRQQTQQINMTVEDNGVGFTAIKKDSSYGMKLIKGLSHELHGKFAFTNEKGTRFQLSIPV